jgi:hypothetical protein
MFGLPRLVMSNGDITQLYTREKHNAGLLRRAIEVEALPESWKSYFQHRLEKLTKIST